MTTCDVTIAIPTLNGGARFRALLERCAHLDPRPAEIVVIDSSSDDGTAEAARAAGCRVEVIPRAEFDHGAVRQRMAERATTRFVAFTVQDALPAADYLASLLRVMDDPQTVAATARILPHTDASSLARRTVLSSPSAAATPRIASCAPGEYARLTPHERRALCFLDDVASLVRREILLRYPFPRTMMGEDAHFAAQVIAAGFRVRFVPESVVEHSHEYSGRAAFDRYRADAAFIRASFGVRIRPGIGSVLRGLLHEVWCDWRFLCGERARDRWREALRSPWLRCWQVLGQWRGSVGANNP